MMRLTVSTSSKIELLDITQRIQEAIDREAIKDGIAYLFVPHTTAAITINENADPSVKEDILAELSKLIPQNGKFRHQEGNADAHIKATIIGSSENIPIEGGKLCLGTWQGIYLCEFDGPRRRHIQVKIIRSNQE